MSSSEALELAPLERVDVTSLDDLATVRVRAEIVHAGRVLVVPLRELNYFDWMRLGYEVPNPGPPIMGTDKQGRPLFDRNDPSFLRAMDEATLERGYVRMLAALDIPIAGDTQAEKLATLKQKLGTNVVRQLTNILNEMANEGEARIVNRSETFHGGRDRGLEDVPAVADHEGNV